MQVLKGRVPDVGFKPFVPQGEAQSCEFPSEYRLLHWGLGLWQDCVSASQLVHCRFFLTHLMYRSCLTRFWVAFRGNCSICSCRSSVSMEEEEFRILLCHHLEPDPVTSSFFKVRFIEFEVTYNNYIYLKCAVW